MEISLHLLPHKPFYFMLIKKWIAWAKFVVWNQRDILAKFKVIFSCAKLKIRVTFASKVLPEGILLIKMWLKRPILNKNHILPLLHSQWKKQAVIFDIAALTYSTHTSLQKYSSSACFDHVIFKYHNQCSLFHVAILINFIHYALIAQKFSLVWQKWDVLIFSRNNWKKKLWYVFFRY